VDSSKLAQHGAQPKGSAMEIAPLAPTVVRGQRSILGRVTLTGALITVAVMSGLYAAMFSAYWLILALFALGCASQTWSFDLDAVAKPATLAE
jgi:hypothetical protein